MEDTEDFGPSTDMLIAIQNGEYVPTQEEIVQIAKGLQVRRTFHAFDRLEVLEWRAGVRRR